MSEDLHQLATVEARRLVATIDPETNGHLLTGFAYFDAAALSDADRIRWANWTRSSGGLLVRLDRIQNIIWTVVAVVSLVVIVDIGMGDEGLASSTIWQLVAVTGALLAGALEVVMNQKSGYQPWFDRRHLYHKARQVVCLTALRQSLNDEARAPDQKAIEARLAMAALVVRQAVCSRGIWRTTVLDEQGVRLNINLQILIICDRTTACLRHRRSSAPAMQTKGRRDWIELTEHLAWLYKYDILLGLLERAVNSHSSSGSSTATDELRSTIAVLDTLVAPKS